MLRIIVIFLYCIGSAVSEANVNTDFINTLSKSSDYQSIKLNPSGQLTAAIYKYEKVNHIEIFDLLAKKSFAVQESVFNEFAYRGIRWIDDNSLVIDFQNNNKKKGIMILHLGRDTKGNISLESSFVPAIRQGYVANALPLEENKLIYIVSKRDKLEFASKAIVFKLDVTDKQSLVSKSTKHVIPFPNLTDTAFDKNNILRAIEVEKTDVYEYYFLDDTNTKWLKIGERSIDTTRYLDAVDESGRIILRELVNDDKYVISYYSKSDFRKLETAYEHPEYDISSVLLDQNKNLIGATFIKDGVFEQSYFDGTTQAVKSKINKNYSGTIYILDISTDKETYLVVLSENGFDYKFYSYTNSADKMTIIKDPKPWLKGIEFSETKVLSVKNRQGQSIEAYLSLPQKTSKNIPLVVMPHGGPFDVRDYRYDPSAEILAQHGFAVLRVNFRGSSGFGRKFIESAKLGWGSIIERDIYDSLQVALSNYSIDKDRICAVGGSYGGYSTAVLLQQHPNLFKCGVSFAGVFDLNVHINEAKRFSNYKEGLEDFFREYVVDLENNSDEQKKKSPIYHAEKIKAPLLLLHGTEDRVVDVEQSYRMQYAMKNSNKEVRLIEMEGVGHGFNNTKQITEYYQHVIPFLNQHLK